MPPNLELLPILSLATLIKSAESSIKYTYISSAFSKIEPFEKICASTSFNGPKVLISRWQFCDLVSGASDFGVYEVAKRFGWNFLFNQNLHAKVYLFDDIVFIGSANMTNRGLAGRPPAGNIEFCVKATENNEVLNWFDTLISSSVPVDDDLYNAILNDVLSYKEISDNRVPTRKGFSQQVNDIISKNKIQPALYLHDLPMSTTPNELMSLHSCEDAKIVHDIKMLGLPSMPTLDQVRKAFELSPGLTWLISVVGQEMYYGAITEKLHDVLCDEPKPYRKEVKEYLSNLLCWAQILFPERIVIDRPQHSQRIRILNL